MNVPPRDRDNDKMCYRDRDELSPEDYREEYVNGERITRFRDGTSLRHGGGPCGPMYYNEFGEEC